MAEWSLLCDDPSTCSIQASFSHSQISHFDIVKQKRRVKFFRKGRRWVSAPSTPGPGKSWLWSSVRRGPPITRDSHVWVPSKLQVENITYRSIPTSRCRPSWLRPSRLLGARSSNHVSYGNKCFQSGNLQPLATHGLHLRWGTLASISHAQLCKTGKWTWVESKLLDMYSVILCYLPTGESWLFFYYIIYISLYPYIHKYPIIQSKQLDIYSVIVCYLPTGESAKISRLLF